MNFRPLLPLLTALGIAVAAGPVAADTFYVANSSGNTVEQFSAAGADLGQFTQTNNRVPTALAFDASGNLYVTFDQTPGAIEKFSPGGAALGTFATTHLTRTYGLVFDAAGNLYAANFGDSTIEKFSPAGVDLGVFVNSGLSGPVGMVFDPAGNLYVANYGANTVGKFSPAGASLGTFANTNLSTPYALTFDAAGNLYVTNVGANKTVEKFSAAGSDLGVFARAGLDGPVGVAFDSAGNCYVANEGSATIRKFSSTGADLGVFATGPTGSAPASLAIRAGGATGAAGTLQFGASSYNVNENGGFLTFNVTRTAGSTGTVTVSYATSDGTAVAGTDYTMSNGTITLGDGVAASANLVVPILDRGISDGSTRTFSIVLSAPTNGATLGAAVSATATILESDTAPQPTISITSPPSNVTLVAGTMTTLSAAVTDPGGLLAKVQFFLNGALYSQSTGKGPFTLAATVPPKGTYTLTATVIDTQGRQNSSTRVVTVVAPPVDPNNPAPVAGFVTPFNGRTLAGGSTVTLTASADSLSPDGAPLARVDFYADNTQVASFDGNGNPLATSATGNPAGRRTADAGAPVPARNGTVFSAAFPIPNLSGLINLLTVATNKNGISQTSAPVTVRAVATSPTSNHAPAVKLGGVTAGQRVRAGVKITVPVTAGDPDAGKTAALAGGIGNNVARRNDLPVPGTVIASVDYFLNQLKVASSTAPPYSFDFTPPAAGTYVIEAIATDDAGLSGVADPVIVQAVAAPPTVSLALPGAGGGVSATVAGGGAPLKVTVTRAAGDDLSLPLTVAYKAKGDAVAGTDYKTLSGTVTIPAGALFAKIKVKSLNNGRPGAGETLKLRLLPPADGSYNVGAPAQVKIRILD